MKDTDFSRFNKTMRALQEAYTPEKPVSKEKGLMYFNLFKSWDWTVDQFEQACFNLFQTKTISTFPVPAEIREALVLNNSLEAWLYARKMVSRYGHNYSLIFEDKVIHSVIEAMGTWPDFTWIVESQLTWKQKEFEKLYNSMMSKKEHPEYISGACDNSENLIDLKTGKQIKPEEAKLIISGKGQQDLLS